MKKIIQYFIALVLCMSCIKKEKEEEPIIDCSPLPTYDCYTYPVIPGTPEWSNLKNIDEMYAACQIPDSIFKKISTAGLVASVFSHPMRHNFALTPDRQIGYNNVKENINAFSELEKRADASAELFKRYQSVHPGCTNKMQSISEKGQFLFDLILIELVIAQDAYSKTRPETEQKKLVAETIKKFEQKKQLSTDVYGVYEYGMSAFVCAKVMYYVKFTPFINEYNKNEQLRKLVNSGPNPEYRPTDLVIEMAKNFIR